NHPTPRHGRLTIRPTTTPKGPHRLRCGPFPLSAPVRAVYHQGRPPARLRLGTSPMSTSTGPRRLSRRDLLLGAAAGATAGWFAARRFGSPPGADATGLATPGADATGLAPSDLMPVRFPGRVV